MNWQQTGPHDWHADNSEYVIFWVSREDGYWVEREGHSDPHLPRAFATLNAAKRFAEAIAKYRSA
jgi:hypothetical protein